LRRGGLVFASAESTQHAGNHAPAAFVGTGGRLRSTRGRVQSESLAAIVGIRNPSWAAALCDGAAQRLAGQRYEYLVEAMRRFAGGERSKSADMTNIMKAMAPAEREAMARYISGL
jgi:hypothetical protein